MLVSIVYHVGVPITKKNKEKIHTFIHEHEQEAKVQYIC